MADDNSDPLIGQVIDKRYELLAVRSIAYSHTTYEAVDRRLNRRVYLGILSRGIENYDTFVVRFAVEASLVARLSHPHLVSMLDQGTESSLTYFVTPEFSGITLAQLLSEKGSLPPRLALALIDPVIEGVAALHEAGLLHEGVTAENVLIDDDGRVAIGELALPATLRKTDRTGYLARFKHVAPEVRRGSPVDARSDVFAIGVLLYELLVGSKPLISTAVAQLEAQTSLAETSLPSFVRSGLVSDIDEFVMWCLASEPRDRAGNAAQLLSELRHVRVTLSDEALDVQTQLVDYVRDLETVNWGRDHIAWLHDAPAQHDELQRKPLAQALATRLRRINANRSASSFAFLLDGPWGVGKTTMLTFIRDELEPDWLVIDFNAWKEAKIGPPWWSMLMRLRSAVHGSLAWQKRITLRFKETAARIKRAGAPFAVAALLFAIVCFALIALFPPASLALDKMNDLAKAASAVLATVGTIWAGVMVASRYFLWDSARGARLFEQSSKDPMEAIAFHLHWLLEQAERPVIFFVDDLDRCQHQYVVDLLEAMHTLIKDGPRRKSSAKVRAAAYFVVAADGAWIRSSYENAYEKFAGSVEEPGGSLGFLFLDKIFQLHITVPHVSPAKGTSYMRSLLTPMQAKEKEAADSAAKVVLAQLEDSSTEAEILEVYRRADPKIRTWIARNVVENLSSFEVERDVEGKLEQFAPLLQSNPRATKRFVNTYSVQRAVTILEGNVVPPETLALWLIMEMRWPSLAHMLRRHPELMSLDEESEDDPVLWKTARMLLRNKSVQEVVQFSHGGPLTAKAVRDCCGG